MILDLQAFNDQKNSSRGHGFVANGDVPNDRYSVWQHGLWVKGHAAGLKVLEGDPIVPVIEGMLFELGKWSLDLFEWWSGYGGYYTVNYYDYDHNSSLPKNDPRRWTHTASSPSRGLSRWCMPMFQLMQVLAYNRLSATDKIKLNTIIDQFITDTPP